MNTEKNVLSDVEDFQNHLGKLVEENQSKRVLVLEAHSDAEKNINGNQYNLLQGLGFQQLENQKSFEAREKELTQIGLKTSTIQILKKAKETYGKSILSYNRVVDICKEHNLYFASSKLFTGKMPIKNVKDLQEFDFDSFKSHYNCMEADGTTTIIKCRLSASPYTMVIAPATDFCLQNVFISNSREIIKLQDHSETVYGGATDDPIVLLPFKINGTGEIFFLVLTYWNNTNSIL